MKGTTSPRVILVDLDWHTELARTVEEALRSWCRVVREEALQPSVEGSTGLSGAAGPINWRERGVVAAVICASTIDAATQRRIARKLRALRGLPVLLVSAATDSALIARLLSRGVSDYVRTPVLAVDVVPRVRRLVGLLPESDAADEPLAERGISATLIGVSAAFRKLIDKILLAAECDATVFLQGETGTGKGVCAQAIHELSGRAQNPFIVVNCGTLQPHLIENELFGHERGAFTGAVGTRHGLVHEARGGTLFIDELNSLALGAQVKLLELLETRKYRRLGSARTLKTDVRFVAATNADPHEAVRSGTIRADLYHRLGAFPLPIPPLRERVEDILPLARHFLRTSAAELGRPLCALSSGAVTELLGYRWPGNVRELKQTIERATVLAGNRTIVTERDIEVPRSRDRLLGSFAESARAFERAYLETLMSSHRGNVSQAAIAAEVDRRTLQRLLRKHRMDSHIYRDLHE